jgi:hypothetical protein
MTGLVRRTLSQMEDERRILVQESERIQLTLGRLKEQRGQRPRRYRRGDPRSLVGNREALKAQLVEINASLRLVNGQIKAERRRLTTVLTEGSPRPRTAFQYMVSLYRLFDDAIPSDQRSSDEQALMRRTRDFVMAGRADHG